MFEEVQVITTGGSWGAFTMGDKVIGDPGTLAGALPSGVSTKKHEQGHYYQNLALGPLYLPVIALPSLIHAAVSPSHATYEQFYTEKWASAWGK
jgi:hypothetical protein